MVWFITMNHCQAGQPAHCHCWGREGEGKQVKKKFTQLCYLHYSSPAPLDKADVVLHQLALSILPSALIHGHQKYRDTGKLSRLFPASTQKRN